MVNAVKVRQRVFVTLTSPCKGFPALFDILCSTGSTHKTALLTASKILY